jgi:hypothetical protein
MRPDGAVKGSNAGDLGDTEEDVDVEEDYELSTDRWVSG